MGMKLKRKLFFLGSGNYKTAFNQIFRLKNRPQGMTRAGSVMRGVGNLTKGLTKTAVGTTAIVGGTALLAGNAVKNAATDG